MPKKNLTSGRTNQKLRTRRAILAAACRLMEQGLDPSMEAVAEEALVSRATIYRYFAGADQLVLEATLEMRLAVQPQKALPPDDAPERAARVQEMLYDLARENEMQFRLFLSSVHKAWVESKGKRELRMGRRLAMIEEALDPVRDQLEASAYRRLVYALAGMMGIESLVIMRDICDLEHDEGRATMGWAVRTLVRAALEETEE